MLIFEFINGVLASRSRAKSVGFRNKSPEAVKPLERCDAKLEGPRRGAVFTVWVPLKATELVNGVHLARAALSRSLLSFKSFGYFKRASVTLQAMFMFLAQRNVRFIACLLKNIQVYVRDSLMTVRRQMPLRFFR